MAEGEFEDNNKPEAYFELTRSNFDYFKMSNGLCRLRTRFLGSDEKIEELEKLINTKFFASEAKKIGLVTFSYDDIDWEDEIIIGTALTRNGEIIHESFKR